MEIKDHWKKNALIDEKKYSSNSFANDVKNKYS